MHEMKKTDEITVNITLEWEYKALEEVVKWSVEQWSYDEEIFNGITKTNQEILKKLASGNNKSRELHFKSEDKELVGLFDTILRNLIYTEPIIARVFIHNSTLTQDIHIRKWLRDNYIHDEAIDLVKTPFDRDWLVDSKLAKGIKLLDGKPVKGIPLRCFFVGEVLNALLEDFEHYKLIDLAKMKGADGSIAELRESRVYKSDEGVVYDYSPLFKKTYLRSGGTTTEHFMIDGFKQPGRKGPLMADNILSSYARKTQFDNRKNEDYRNNLDTSKFNGIVHNTAEKKTIPSQLLLKWDGIIRRNAQWKTGYRFSEEGFISQR
jgi:hypothetical protein